MNKTTWDDMPFIKIFSTQFKERCLPWHPYAIAEQEQKRSALSRFE